METITWSRFVLSIFDFRPHCCLSTFSDRPSSNEQIGLCSAIRPATHEKPRYVSIRPITNTSKGSPRRSRALRPSSQPQRQANSTEHPCLVVFRSRSHRRTTCQTLWSSWLSTCQPKRQQRPKTHWKHSMMLFAPHLSLSRSDSKSNKPRIANMIQNISFTSPCTIFYLHLAG